MNKQQEQSIRELLGEKEANMFFLSNFVNENKKSGGLSKDISDKIEQLWNKYKLTTIDTNCAIITADFGFLGSLVIRTVKSVEESANFTLKYQSGSYDYVTILSDNTRKLLWTDFSSEEPYNRQGGLYCDGATFEFLGKPVNKGNYREFDAIHQYDSNITFGIWGYDFNDFYGSVRFGICLPKDQVDLFIQELREIIGK